MIPGMGGRGMNPKKLAAMMRQMGIEMEEYEGVEEVVIRFADREIVFTQPEVSRMKAQGQVTWQLAGNPVERRREGAAPKPLTISDADVALVAEQAHASKDAARKALEECGGDLAEAILKLTS